MLPHPSTNFEIKKYYQNETISNGVYSADNLPKVKDETYMISLDEFFDIGTHWIPLDAQNNNVTYFESFGVERIPEEIKTFIGNKNIKANIFRMQACDSIVCRYFWIVFVDCMLAGKILTYCANFFFTK